ncbi:MAG: hypothetical protein GTO01_10570, partial [Xanthomonadales bacterium]|nr:hypothetical protein [Xanthomonadales bacterium]NIT08943.1 hypothetical protein [Xanthomonadales bacterium]
RDIMGFDGYARARGGTPASIDQLWLPVHRITDEFFGALSVGSFKTSRSLRHY